MNCSIFARQKNNKFRSLHYSPTKQIQTQRQRTLETRNQTAFKPDFLYFTLRQRQNIKLLETSEPLLKLKQRNSHKQIDKKISTSFHKKFKQKSKRFDIKKNSLHKNTQQPEKQNSFIIQGKSKLTLKKKARFYTNEEPCVGMYNAKPENFMKRIAKNQVFRKGKSCHILTYKEQNHSDLLIKNESFYVNNISEHHEQKNPQRQKIRKKGALHPLIMHKIQEMNISPKKTSSSKIRIKCFDMSKQTSRLPLKFTTNKVEETDCENDYIKNNYKRSVFMPTPLNQNELEALYDKQKRKYEIQSSCGILKHIKLEDFIKIHRNESTIEESIFE